MKTDKELFNTNRQLEQLIAERNIKLRENELHLIHSERIKTLGIIAGGIAHDYNNHLMGIMNCAEKLCDHLDSRSGLYEISCTIRNTAQQSATLSTRLLNLSRIHEQVQKNIDMHQIITDAISLMSHSSNESIVIKSKLSASNACITGNSSQMQNVILNLGLNSRDAMEHGGVLRFFSENITITSETSLAKKYCLDPGSFLHIIIQDTGSGISPDIAEKVFEPFFTTKKDGKGSGMGLTLAYGTIKSLKGVIFYENRVNGGTNFHMYIPTTPISIAETDSSLSQGGNRAINCKTNKTTILFVDDETLIREAVVNFFRNFDYTIIPCKDGSEAVEKYNLKQEAIELIILDMVMPSMNGVETFHALKQINPHARIIISSGYSSSDDIDTLLEKGATAFLQKPFQMSELLKKVNQVLS